MFRLDARPKVYVHRDAVDGRKNLNGPAQLVEQALGLDPFAAAAYVFSDRRRNRVKILLKQIGRLRLVDQHLSDRHLQNVSTQLGYG